jgi:hypothetical protein
MLLSALSVSHSLCGGSVHYEIRLDSGSTKALQSSERSLLVERMDQVRNLRSHLMLDPKRIRAIEAVAIRHYPLGRRCCSSGSHLLCVNSSGYCMAFVVLSRLLLLCVSMGVVERIVELCCNPQAMQEHRELPRHGHRRSLL